MTRARLELTRSQILAFRRRVGALDRRLPWGPDSLRVAAWAGLQDSMPRAALLSIHARLEATPPDALDHPSLVQVWGPRFSAYVIAAAAHPIFTLGRYPEDAKARRRADDIADRLEAFLDGRTMGHGEAGHALGVNPNLLRYAAPTGRVLIHWDGARGASVWTVPAPDVDPSDARRELARRYLHVFGPARPEAFAEWAGIRNPARSGKAAFSLIGDALTPVRTPIGDAWILAEDEAEFLAEPGPEVAVRLLPSGDTYWLLQGVDRELLVPDAASRSKLWTPRVWPGALLVDGEIVGTWRRAGHTVTVSTWRRLSPEQSAAVETEAASLPLPGIDREIVTRWED